MAYETGNATDYRDLLLKLKTFLTTNVDLIAASEEWIALRSVVMLDSEGYSDELILKGPGAAGTDEIYVGIKCFQNPTDDLYNWILTGMVGFNTVTPWDDQPGQMPKVGLSLWNSPIKYWVVANGRRFVLVAKVSSFYVTMHAGFILPYATPSQYPYPNFVAGNIPSYLNAFLTENYSWNSPLNSNFWRPCDVNSDRPNTGAHYLYWLDGSWRSFKNVNYLGGTFESVNTNLDSFENEVLPFNPVWMRDTMDGQYIIQPWKLAMRKNPSHAIAGALDDVYHVSGFNNASENIITIGIDSYLVVQNVFRNGVGDFAVVKLA